MKKTLTLAGLACLGLTSFASAVIVVDTESIRPPDNNEDVNTPFTPNFAAGNVSSTDLLNGLTATTLVGGFNRGGAAGPGVLTDGTFDTAFGSTSAGPANVGRNAFASIGQDANAQTGQTITYSLGGAFNLSEIVIYGGWVDGGRDQQNLDILVSTDGTLFTSLGATLGGNEGNLNHDTDPNVNGGAENFNTRSPVVHRNSITEDTAPFLAAGVTHVRFDQQTVENGYTGYAEFDVFGTAVPEPSTSLLGALGLGMLFIRRKR